MRSSQREMGRKDGGKRRVIKLFLSRCEKGRAAVSRCWERPKKNKRLSYTRFLVKINSFTK